MVVSDHLTITGITTSSSGASALDLLGPVTSLLPVVLQLIAASTVADCIRPHAFACVQRCLFPQLLLEKGAVVTESASTMSNKSSLQPPLLVCYDELKCARSFSWSLSEWICACVCVCVRVCARACMFVLVVQTILQCSHHTSDRPADSASTEWRLLYAKLFLLHQAMIKEPHMSDHKRYLSSNQEQWQPEARRQLLSLLRTALLSQRLHVRLVARVGRRKRLTLIPLVVLA